MKAWFCYEFNHANKPIPVIYYHELPTSSVEGKERVRRREQVVEISGTKTAPDGEFSLSELQKRYPYLSEKGSIDNTTAPVVEKKQEIHDMTRPVEGFLTIQGKFFERKEDARLYEARYALNKVATDAVVQLGVVGEDNIENAIEALVAFVNQNDKCIEEYVNAKRDVEASAAMPGPVELDRSATTDHPTDDTSLRIETTVQVDDSPTPETNTKTTRNSTKS